ncbi:E3 ubiquitin-protein ligase PRT1-like [Durio zibethinus]|uniref:E3 ubiquitin-protein ligase PRT1-like n=1 Tax=Durio zibethinus TaxID=66656 RepID=A0A6P6A5L7_DURZI|nr:E3 ubiquitin-protein ligase PRT1-like [Durio zibethinus]
MAWKFGNDCPLWLRTLVIFKAIFLFIKSSKIKSPKYPADSIDRYRDITLVCHLSHFKVDGNSMDSSQTCLMEERQSPNAVDVIDSEEIPDYFVCCICLDLLYKPIVLHCGHISCFWCVHRSMSSRCESRCPICRNPYSHFAGICQMLHFLLLKLYPIAYKKREDQILEEEKRDGYFSPEFNGHACESQADGDLNQTKLVAGEEKVQVSDLLCTACKQLLFHPIVLNCGHVYCQTCIIIPADEMLRCQVCPCLHPKGFPKVCLTLDQFLGAKFPKEYASRRNAVHLKQVSSKHERATTCSMEAGKKNFSPVQLLPFSMQPSAYIHIGVGCDACGMSPIVGDRYKCKDCTEKIGFDLCGDCYNTRPKLPGRFNQRHTPEHKFELIKHNLSGRLRLMTEHLENGSTSFLIFDDASENLENGPLPRALFGDSQDNMEDEDDALSTD